MNFVLVFQVSLLLTLCLSVDSSPVSDPSDEESESRVFRLEQKPDFPVADMIEEDPNIKTHVIGKMDDLEATTWISSLSELDFTFPPDLARDLYESDT